MSIRLTKKQNRLVINGDNLEKTPGVNFEIPDNNIRAFGLHWTGKTGDSIKTISSIASVVDSSGFQSNDVLTGKIILSTSGDDGVLKRHLEIDKDGRVTAFGQLWVTTYMPSGYPFVLQSHYDEESEGCRAVFRRSRNTYLNPTSVKQGDSIFRLTFSAHDGFQYKDTAYISAAVSGKTSKGIIPSQLSFKTTDDSGKITEALTITKNQTVEVKGVLKVSVIDQPKNIIAEKGMIIFNDSKKKFQGFNGDEWIDLHL
jgi:hypothetical protein